MKHAATMRVLLMELATAHDEVLLSYALDLQHLGVPFEIACPSVVRDRLPLPSDVPWCEAMVGGSLWDRARMALRIRRTCKRNAITHVIVVTATGTTVRDVVRILPGACTVVGVLHDLSKLEASVNQRLTERGLDAYIVLAPHMARLATRSRLPVHCVPATAVPDIEAGLVPPRQQHEIRIAIPGSMQESRKDLAALCDDGLMHRIPNTVRFIMLGDASGDASSHRMIRAWAERHPGRVVLFNGYVPHAVVHAWVSASDAILPLIHPGCREYREFIDRKITGALSLAAAHGLPILLERGFHVHPELRERAMFYDVQQLADVIGTIRPSKGHVPGSQSELRQAALMQALVDPQRPLETSNG